MRLYALFADGVYVGDALANEDQIFALRNRLAKIYDVFLDLLVAFPVESVV